MLATRQFKLPDETGNTAEDLKRLRKTISDYFTDLQKSDGLAIATTQYWVPVPTFSTPGDVAFTPTIRVGDLVTMERTARLCFRIAGVITHTTAAGSLQLTGLPVNPASETRDANLVWDGACFWSGITFAAGYTQIVASLTTGSNIITFSKSGTGVAGASVTTADVPTGGTLILRGNISFRI
jgi:hypothetical protein